MDAILSIIDNVTVQLESGEIVVRTLEYSLPDAFKGHIDMVQPTTFFGLKAMRSTIKNVHAFDGSTMNTNAVEAVTGCSGSTITPKCLSNLYSFSGATAYTNGLMGIAGFLSEHPSKSDLTTFMNSYATEGNAGQTYTCTLINGGTCPTCKLAGKQNLKKYSDEAILTLLLPSWISWHRSQS
jgi:tripeptidyl-peptidase-1